MEQRTAELDAGPALDGPGAVQGVFMKSRNSKPQTSGPGSVTGRSELPAEPPAEPGMHTHHEMTAMNRSELPATPSVTHRPEEPIELSAESQS